MLSAEGVYAEGDVVLLVGVARYGLKRASAFDVLIFHARDVPAYVCEVGFCRNVGIVVGVAVPYCEERIGFVLRRASPCECYQTEIGVYERIGLSVVEYVDGCSVPSACGYLHNSSGFWGLT